MQTSMIKLAASAALAAGFMIGAVLPAAAGEVQDRMTYQQHRIHEGVRDGQISRREARNDERRLARIREERRRDLRHHDGHMTRADYQRENNQLNRNSHDIYEQRH